MQYRRLGRSGLEVSVIGLGGWLTFGARLDEEETTTLVREALAMGVNFFDTADVYEMGRGEAALGRALAAVPRKEFVVASKCFFPTGSGPNDRGLSRKHIEESLSSSLARLQLDYIDLYQCHRYDEETPIEETVHALDDHVRQGRILYWGVSSWTAEQVEEAVETARDLGATPPISNQSPYSLLDRGIEESVMPACSRYGLGVVPYSPLAQGVLTGKYCGGAIPDGSRGADERRNQFMRRFLEPELLERVERLTELAEEAGLTPAQLALAWVLRREEVSSVMVGATAVSQLEENVGAAAAGLAPILVGRLDEIFPA